MKEQAVIEQSFAHSIDWKLDGDFVLNEALRANALTYLSENAFPTTRTEAWKYTRLTKIKNNSLHIASAAPFAELAPIDAAAISLVFVNGHFDATRSASDFPAGMKVIPLSQMDEAERNVLGEIDAQKTDLFSAINTAYATDGVYIHVSARVQIAPTIAITHITTGDHVLVNLRHIIHLEKFAELNMIQQNTTDSGENAFSNIINQVYVGENARLTIDKLQNESEHAFHHATEFINQQKDSVFTINTITLNGGWVRNNLNCFVNGVNCETNLNGAYVLTGNQHVDNHTVVDHMVAHCNSNELYKGVIDGKATAVFNGKVFVRKDAQKINAFQSNGNVLMSLDASVNSKPELEIYADDVKCSHGSTTGQLDEEAVFYLRARGLSEASARQLMVGAFINDVFEKIENEHVVAWIHDEISKRFNWSFE